MSRVVRPSTPEDAPAIVALLKESGLRASRRAADLRWKYWQARADCPEPRSWVLVNGNDVIAHAAAIRGTCVWGGERLSVIHMIDWAARPGEVGAGATLMKHLGRQTALVAIGGSADTLRILPHVGFRPLGVATGYVRTLFPLRYLRGIDDPTWRLLPRFARRVAWTLAAPAPRTRNWRPRRLRAAETDVLADVLPAPVGAAAALLERSLALLVETLSCPIVRLTLYGVENSAGIGGYFLLASAPGQVRIADCWMRSADPADWREMVLCAVAEARRDPQAAEVVIWASDPLLSGVLPACGFHARSTMPIQLRPVAGLPHPTGPLRVQMLDNDAVWMHAERREYAA
jgi:hypothetical protein